METSHVSARPDSAEFLSQQAAERLAAAAAPERPKLADLLHLARRLNRAMPPVALRPGFAAELRAQLDLARPEAEATRRREKDQRRRWIAGIGSAVALLGLGIVTYRTAQAVTSKGTPRPAPAGLGQEHVRV